MENKPTKYNSDPTQNSSTDQIIEDDDQKQQQYQGQTEIVIHITNDVKREKSTNSIQPRQRDENYERKNICTPTLPPNYRTKKGPAS